MQSFHCIKMVVTMNPCKCGYYPDMTRCTCTERELHGYLYKISQPLLDRMDLMAEMSRVSVEDLLSKTQNKGESSLVIRKRVEAVHEIQKERYQGTAYRFNGDLDTAGIRRYCEIGAKEEHFMEKLYRKFELTARGYCRILKVARTIADMERSEQIKEKHLYEAVCFRAVDQKYWR